MLLTENLKILVSLQRKSWGDSLVYSSISNKIWDRRLWNKEGNTFRGIYQNPRGLLYALLTHLPAPVFLTIFSHALCTYLKHSSSPRNTLSASVLVHG